MCGLAGIFGNFGPEQTREALTVMLRTQQHRGPDSTGMWCRNVCGTDVGLGLSRLKILDLSDAANQPMVSEDGRYVLVYNGEVYNYVELREELAASGVRFRTQGDTELVLQALIQWGPNAFVRFNGMWALALLDVAAGEVLLSRDRFGIKPLYTYTDHRGFHVASEIKTILAASRGRFQVNPAVAHAFLCQNLLCTSAATFFSGIEEFPAGSWAIVPLTGVRRQTPAPRRFWTIPTAPAGGSSNHTSVDRDEPFIESVRATFLDAVRLRLRSDVPIGVLLSGGTDSSAIAAALQYLCPSAVEITLISAIGAAGRDEQPFIDLMANHLKRPVEKVSLNYSPSRALALMGEVSWYNDEPLGSFSTVAHYLLMRRARELGITVLLSGQGADELLCGYRKYLGFYLQELLRSGSWLAAAGVLRSFLDNGTVLSQVRYREAKRYLPQWLRLREIDVRGAALLEVKEKIDVGLSRDGVVGRQVIDVERLSVPALVHYEDRMSMAMAREIRLPFLDYRLVSLLVPLATEYKLRDGWTKWVFRQAMEPLLPREIAWRKDKQHFIVPQNEWFRCELRQEVVQLLESEWVTAYLGLIDPQKMRARYAAYLRQRTQDGRLGFKDIFAPIALELWARRFEPYLCR
jgi:asparagine synthase (glutamine-hydrolysing)